MRKITNPYEHILNFIKALQKLFEPSAPVALPPAPSEEADLAEIVDGWPEYDGPLEYIPRGRKGMIKVYGDPSVTYTRKGARVSREFARRLHTVPSDRIPGYHRRIYMHRLVTPYFVEAMRRTRVVAPDYKITSIGCFNPRHMRHDKSRPLSDHTWAVAFDVNGSKNRARYRKPGDPMPFDDEWYSKGFGDMPKAMVLAWESLGFTWGGRWGVPKEGRRDRGGFHDPMHFSLRR